MKHLINTRDFSLEEVEHILARADEFLDEKPRDILKLKVSYSTKKQGERNL